MHHTSDTPGFEAPPPALRLASAGRVWCRLRRHDLEGMLQLAPWLVHAHTAAP